MSDWLREGLDDLATEVPTTLEVPSTLPRRARRRIAFTMVGSLVVVVAVAAVAVAGGQSLFDRRDTGVSPTPTSTPTPAPEPASNTVRVVLSDAGCSLDWSEDVIDPERVKFVLVNSTGDWASFDIGRIADGHSFTELAMDVIALGPSPVEEVGELSPRYFESVVALGYVDGRIGRLLVYDMPEIWTSPYRLAAPGDYAVICARGPEAGGPFVSAGVTGPVRIGERTPGGGTQEEGVLLANVVLDDDGCRIDERFVFDSVDIDYAAFELQNHGSTKASFDVARFEGYTFEQVAASIASLAGRDDPRFPAELPDHLTRVRGSGDVGMAGGHGGMGPVRHPYILNASWTSSWNGPTGGIAGEQSLVVICYRDEGTGPGLAPVSVLGPFVVR